MKSSKARRATDRISVYLAELVNSLPSTEEKDILIARINELIKSLTELREGMQNLPSETERTKISDAAEMINDFLLRVRNDPTLASILGFSQRPKRTLANQSRELYRRVDLGELAAELERTPSENLRLKIDTLSNEQLRSLAERKGIKVSTKETRDELIAKILKLGFINPRGYEILRNGLPH